MADRINQNGSNTKGGAKKAILARGRLFATIFVVALVMFYAVLGMSYLGELKKHGALASQLAEVNQTLSELPSPPQDLEQRLAEAEAGLAAEQSLFPDKISTTQLINTILAQASSCGVKATPMATQPWSTEKVGEHVYPVLQLTIAAEGSFNELVTFANELGNGEYATLVIKSLNFSRNTEQSEAGANQVIGTLKLAVYARSLTSE
jgi:Tfp pilus assembly protein PilO